MRIHAENAENAEDEASDAHCLNMMLSMMLWCCGAVVDDGYYAENCRVLSFSFLCFAPPSQYHNHL